MDDSQKTIKSSNTFSEMAVEGRVDILRDKELYFQRRAKMDNSQKTINTVANIIKELYFQRKAKMDDSEKTTNNIGTGSLIYSERGSASQKIQIGSNNRSGLIIVSSALVLALGGAWGLGLRIKLNPQGIQIGGDIQSQQEQLTK